MTRLLLEELMFGNLIEVKSLGLLDLYMEVKA